MAAKKKCPYCNRMFHPDPRLGEQQKACFRKKCKKKRHDESHAQWREKDENREIYSGRYGNTKTWRVKHPRYQRQWRRENPEKVAKDNRQRRERRARKRRENAEIQDAMLRRKIAGIRQIRGAEIQDTIHLKIAGILDVLEACPWRERAEIQDSMAS